MKNMQIFEPAMCCDTGLCGVGIDPELLRISTVLNSLSKNGVTVERFNLSSAPQVFVTNKVVNNFVREKGVEELPLITLDGEVIMTGRYPTNDEFVTLLNVPQNYLGDQKVTQEETDESEGCCCAGGGCC
jgi:hypothetical protein